MKTAIFGAALLAAFALTGCGGSGAPTNPTGSDSTSVANNNGTPAPNTDGNNGAAPAAGSGLDLSKYGIALSIKAPAGAQVVAKSGVVLDVTVKAENFFVQIYGQDALSTDDRRNLKADALAEVKGTKEFSAVVLEEEFGFVYETKWQNGTKAYNFRYIVLKDSKMYDFRSNVVTPFTREQAEAMYRAVKQE